MHAKFRQLIQATATLVVMCAGCQQVNAAIASGWELLETTHVLTLEGIQWKGVPLGTFDFGGQVGVQEVGTADTVVRREFVSEGLNQFETHYLVVEAMQWVSLSPFDAGAGLDLHYITLSSPTGGGRLNTFIGWDGQGIGPVCDYLLDFEFEVRKGALDGPVVDFGLTRFAALDMCWSAQPPAGALVLPGVNDAFWFGWDALSPMGGDIWTWRHRYAVPEPQATAIFMIVALAGWVVGRRVRSNRTLDPNSVTHAS